MNQTMTYLVPDVSSGHCRVAITAEVGALPGVDSVHVDLGAQRVAVTGAGLDDAAIRAAIYDAGYEALSTCDGDSRPRHRRGVTDVSGVYCLGLSWHAEFIAGEVEAAGLATATGGEATNYEYEGAPTPRAAGAMEGV